MWRRTLETKSTNVFQENCIAQHDSFLEEAKVGFLSRLRNNNARQLSTVVPWLAIAIESALVLAVAECVGTCQAISLVLHGVESTWNAVDFPVVQEKAGPLARPSILGVSKYRIRILMVLRIP